jgi:hypothetical protein
MLMKMKILLLNTYNVSLTLKITIYNYYNIKNNNIFNLIILSQILLNKIKILNNKYKMEKTHNFIHRIKMMMRNFIKLINLREKMKTARK